MCTKRKAHDICAAVCQCPPLAFAHAFIFLLKFFNSSVNGKLFEITRGACLSLATNFRLGEKVHINAIKN